MPEAGAGVHTPWPVVVESYDWAFRRVLEVQVRCGCTRSLEHPWGHVDAPGGGGCLRSGA